MSFRVRRDRYGNSTRHTIGKFYDVCVSNELQTKSIKGKDATLVVDDSLIIGGDLVVNGTFQLDQIQLNNLQVSGTAMFCDDVILDTIVPKTGSTIIIDGTICPTELSTNAISPKSGDSVCISQTLQVDSINEKTTDASITIKTTGDGSVFINKVEMLDGSVGLSNEGAYTTLASDAQLDNTVLIEGRDYTFSSLTSRQKLESRHRDFSCLSEARQILASDGTAGDEFGTSCAVDGEFAVVGAPGYETSRGAAYILKRHPNGIWSQIQKIVASDSTFSDEFGSSVSISGNFIVVGAPLEDNDGSDSGAAYVFELRSDGTWEEKQKLKASNYLRPGAASQGQFGTSVSISGQTLIVGTPMSGSVGAAYIFERDCMGIWIEIRILAASSPAASDHFGNSVSISGNFAIVGAEDKGANDNGAAYIFEKDPITGWPATETQLLIASDGAANDNFGSSVAIDGTRAVVGASGFNSDVGKIYTFERDNSGIWIETQIINSIVASPFLFGNSVSIKGDYLAVGAKNALSTLGVVAVLVRDSNGVWSLPGGISSVLRGETTGDMFGHCVGISGNYLIVGANERDENGNNSGKAYVYEASLYEPVIRSDEIKADEIKADEIKIDIITSKNGGAIQLNDTLVGNDICINKVGLFNENTCTNLVSDAQLDNTVLIEGRDYTFSSLTSRQKLESRHRDFTCLSEAREILASDGAAGDEFGTSCAIDGEFAVVGAPGDEFSRGAAYILKRHPNGTWSEIQKIIEVGGNRVPGDIFGQSVSISGNFVIVGAPGATGPSGNQTGLAFIFELQKDGKTWQQIKLLEPSDAATTANGSKFGLSVSISGQTAIIGAPDSDKADSNAGVAYIFERDVFGDWVETRILQATFINSGDDFGISVAISGNFAIVGNSKDQGSASIFEKDPVLGWPATETQSLVASDGTSGDNFGSSVAIDGTRAVVGASGFNSDVGKIYTFERDNSGIWIETQIIPSVGVSGDKFGSSVSLKGDYLVASAANTLLLLGVCVLLKRNSSGVWIQAGNFIQGQSTGDMFGVCVGISGNYLIVGANGRDENGNNSGKAYMYESSLYEPVIQTDQIKSSTSATITIDNNLCIEGILQTDTIEAKSGATVTIDDNLCINGILQTDTIEAKSGATVTIDGILLVENNLCIEGILQTDTIEAKSGNSINVNNELRDFCDKNNEYVNFIPRMIYGANTLPDDVPLMGTMSGDVYGKIVSVSIGGINTNGYRIFASECLIINGPIRNNGNNGNTGGTGAPSGTLGGGADGGPSSDDSALARGNNSNNTSVGGFGGIGGQSMTLIEFPVGGQNIKMSNNKGGPDGVLIYNPTLQGTDGTRFTGGSGGGGGMRNGMGGESGGAGGGGGGVIFIMARKIVVGSMSAVIEAKGGDGGSVVNNAGAGGGGSGGLVVIITRTSPSIFESIIDISGGSGGVNSSNSSYNGAQGDSGRYVIFTD